MKPDDSDLNVSVKIQVSWRKWDIFTPITSLNHQLAFHLTSEQHLLLICKLSPPLSSKQPHNHPPWFEAAISSFLFNPLLLVCAFPPFVSMVMLSALHQEPWPVCSLISLSPLFTGIVFPMSLNKSPLLFLSLSFGHPALVICSSFVCLPSFFHTVPPIIILSVHWFFSSIDIICISKLLSLQFPYFW